MSQKVTGVTAGVTCVCVARESRRRMGAVLPCSDLLRRDPP